MWTIVVSFSLSFSLGILARHLAKLERNAAARTDLPDSFTAMVMLPNDECDKTLYRIERPIKVDKYMIPNWFITDLATIPDRLTWIFPKSGAYSCIAMVHDRFCTRSEEMMSYEYRREGDKEFLRMLLKYGFTYRAYPMYYGVTAQALLNKALGMYE